MDWFNLPKVVTKIFTPCEDAEFKVTLAAYTDDVCSLLNTIKDGSATSVGNALQSLVYWTKSRSGSTVRNLVEKKALRILSDRLAANSNQKINQHILVIFESLLTQDEFFEQAQKEGIINILLGVANNLSRTNRHLAAKIILGLGKRSGFLIEQLVISDGLEHVVKWVKRGDKILRNLGAEILLEVSKECAEFRVLMAVEGCIETAFKVLGQGQGSCSISLSAMLSNMSCIGDVRLIMIENGTTQAMLSCLQDKSPAVVNNVMTVLANLSVIPEARTIIRNSGGIPKVVRLLDSDNVAIVSMAACAIANLAMEGSSQRIIRDSGALPVLGKLLISDSRHMAVLALDNMARSDQLRWSIIDECGIENFVEMLSDSNEVCREEATRLLDRLCIHSKARTDAITLGAPAKLIKLFQDERPSVRYHAILCLTTIEKGTALCSTVFCEEAIIGVVNLLKDPSPRCRDQAAETLEWLVNDAPDIQRLAMEHKVVERLLTLMEDTLEDGSVTDACIYSSICLHHFLKHQGDIVKTIGHAHIIPRLINVIHASRVEVKRIIIKLIRMLVDVLGHGKVITEDGQLSLLIDLLAIEDEECRESILTILASCCAHQEALESIVDKYKVKGDSEDEDLCIENEAMDETWVSAQAAKSAFATHETLLSLDDDQCERKDAGLRILTSWYSLRSTGDLLSDEEIHLASLMPNRLLKAIAHELSGSIGGSSQSEDSPRII